MSLDTDVYSLWAKTTEDGSYHALPYHLIDVGETANAFWRHLAPSVQRSPLNGFGLTEADMHGWLIFFAASHDVGKANPAFQGKARAQAVRLAAAGIETKEKEPFKHGVATTCALKRWLPRHLQEWDAPAIRALAACIGGHHGIFANNELRADLALGVDDRWRALQDALLDDLAELYLPSAIPKQPAELNGLLMWLAGFVSVADWMGSMQECFATREGGMTLPDYRLLAGASAQNALARAHWEPWRNYPRVPLKAITAGREPNDLQKATLNVVDESPRLVVVEAPTGEGKTEAAMALLEAWRTAEGQPGAYFALPTMATSNGMFDRVTAFLGLVAQGGEVELRLLHGRAPYEERFDAIRIRDNANAGEDERQGPVAHDWFGGRKRGLLAPYGVGTIDQALMATLRVRHGFVRLFALTGKTVVLDEVHAYDVYMSSLLDRLLGWLRALGCTVVVLSATLPAKRRKDILRAFGAVEAPTAAYPCLSFVREDGTADAEGFCVRERQPVRTEARTGDVAEGARAILDAVRSHGGCGALVLNTVGRAQDAFRLLQGSCEAEGIALCLFHARFPYFRRSEIEAKVLREYGKAGPRPGRAILVATQVVEQSLDLDFDHLVSDVAPIDLLVQRAGRLHRHDRGERGQPVLTVLNPPPREDGTPDYGPYARVYSEAVLLRTSLLLRGTREWRMPDDATRLIEGVYAKLVDRDAEGAWGERLVMADARDEESRRASEKIAEEAILQEATHEDYVTSTARLEKDEDDPEAHEHFRAVTRLGDPSVEAVCLWTNPEGTLSLDEEGQRMYDIGRSLYPALVRSLMMNTVSISLRDVVPVLLGRKSPPSWREHGSLRHARPLEFANGRCDLGSLVLCYDRNLGIYREPA